MSPAKHFIVHTDGGARGNPGPAAIGYVIESPPNIYEEHATLIGSTTNNQAEYQAIVAALERVKHLGASSADIYADSELVVRQLRGEYKLKNRELGEWFIKARSLVQIIGHVSFFAIPREMNKQADQLVNQALDQARYPAA